MAQPRFLAKSNQGGIETASPQRPIGKRRRAKSNQGGIETYSFRTGRLSGRGAKSNQGGIETAVRVNAGGQDYVGKIEPRWD